MYVYAICEIKLNLITTQLTEELCITFLRVLTAQAFFSTIIDKKKKIENITIL